MEDQRIVELYWQRDERAITETERKYEKYLFKIAQNILFDREDCRESVNDTYFKAWNAMPPHKPNVLAPFLGKITRELAIDRYRKNHTKKRYDFQYTLSLSELGECVSGKETAEDSVEAQALAKALNDYIKTLSREARIAFVGRYFFMDSIKEIAVYCGASQGKIKSSLYRSRMGLREHLEKEGFEL